MAKVSREQLKGIVKECLVEILEEGLLRDVASAAPTKAPPRRSSVSHHPTESVSRHEASADSRAELAIHEAVSSLTKDSIMSSIFHDTAKTTLQEQLSAERAPGTGPSTQSQVADNLGDVFGESASRWTNLAFPEKKK